MINKIKSSILFSIFYFLLSINRANAAGGLVPCGTSDTPACNWCFFGSLAANIINFMMYLIFPLAAIMIVVGGIFIMTSGGSSDRFSRGKEMVTAAVIGILIALISWMIIDTIIKIIAVGWNGISGLGPWNKISC